MSNTVDQAPAPPKCCKTCCGPGFTTTPIRYSDGAIELREVDIEVPGGGMFGHVRAYGNQPVSTVYNGPNGYNWWIPQFAYCALVGSSSPGTVAVTFDANEVYWFDYVGSVYIPRYSFLNVTLVEDTMAQTFTFTDNSNGQTEVTVFNSLAATTNPGMFVSRTDGRKIQTTVTSITGSQINELQRTVTVGSVVTIQSLLYTYYSSGSAAGYLQSVLFRTKIGSGSWTDVTQAVSVYYGSSVPNGNLNDLQSVSQQIPDGMGGWNTIATSAYRYGASGFAHGLRMHFGPEACRLLFNAGLDPATASDAAVLPYVDHYFEYDSGTWAVTKEIAAVCPSCPGGGTTTDLFAYSANTFHGLDFNIWVGKNSQTLPDGSFVLVYTNFAGQPMLKITVDPLGGRVWAVFYRYDSEGRVMWVAQPSAVALPSPFTDVEMYPDLLNFNVFTGKYQYLHDTVGLINATAYDGRGNVTSQSVMQGQTGSSVLVNAMTYTSNTDSAGNVITPIATSVKYPDDTTTSITITTSFAYTFYSGTNVMSQRTTTLPVVSTGQNGSNAADTTVENFDTFGNPFSSIDERGVVNVFVVDPLTALTTQTTLNYQSGVTGPGINVITDLTFDGQGRLTKTLGPAHTVVPGGGAVPVQPATWVVYNQSAQPGSGTWDVDSTWTGTGYLFGTTYSLVDPVAISNTDKDGRSTDEITSARTTGSGALSPTDTFAQTDWKSWSSTQYDPQHRTVSSRVYHDIPSSGLGVVGTNYGQTDFGYDALERRNRFVTPGGTIIRTVWTTPQWELSKWVGTNDAGATDADPSNGGAPPNNMVQTILNEYDGGSDGGDGNLTQRTKFVSATSGDTRVTAFGYDFRDRKISVTDPTNRYALATIDNLGRTSLIQVYATLGGNLIRQKGTNWDDRGRAYQNLVYAVDPTTGTVGNVLTGNSWYDPSSNLLQRIAPGAGIVFTKFEYNGVNWVTASYVGYNTSGTSYSQAGTVSGDVIISQSLPTFDEVGNTISQASFQRLNDESPTTTGALSYGTSPKARVSYSAAWFDRIDRVIANANYGAISSFSRPSTPPSSSATILVAGLAYDSAGRNYQTTDAKGIIAEAVFDDAGRKITTIDDVGGLNRTTNFTFTLDNLTASIDAVNAATGNQITRYLYGTTLTESGVARNDLLRFTVYPDTPLGWSTLSVDDWAGLSVDDWAGLEIDPIDGTQNTYNRLGEVVTFTDQRGTVHTFVNDKLGRQTDDCVTTVGGATDSAVLRISRGYEIRGMVNVITSFDNATPGSGTVLNQVALSYNDFGQPIEDEQEHGGAVGGSTPSVQYGYDTGGSGSNEIRPSTLTYPNARELTNSYGTSGGMNDLLNRVETIQDTTSGTTNLATYDYLGLDSVIKIDLPEPQVNLDLWGGTTGVFTGFDHFGRVIDQSWYNYNTSTMLDEYKYGYDQNSNALWKQNVVGTPIVTNGLDEFYGYDSLNRLLGMKRGTLNGTQTAITGTPTVEQDWALDPTGNWSNFLTKSAGTTDLDQTRTSNVVNEITNITESTGPTWIVPAYDDAGNTTTMPQTADPTQSLAGIYDAWNRLVEIDDSGTPVAKYQFDGRGLRIVRDGYTSGILSETRQFYFTASGRDVEQRLGTSTSMDQQHVWGLRYVNELVCRDDSTPQRLYALQDGSYCVTAVTSSVGVTQERFTFDPYGISIVRNSSWSPIADALGWTRLFQGGPFDPQTGLYLFGRRTYGPALGGWSQRDAGYWDGMNRYAAFRTNPTTGVDPGGQATAIPAGPGGVPTVGSTAEQVDLVNASAQSSTDAAMAVMGATASFVNALWAMTGGNPGCDSRRLPGSELERANRRTDAVEKHIQEFYLGLNPSQQQYGFYYGTQVIILFSPLVDVALSGARAADIPSLNSPPAEAPPEIPKLYYYGPKTYVANKQANGMFYPRPGAQGRYWVTTDPKPGMFSLSTGGSVLKDMSEVYVLTNEEAALFKPAQGFEFSWDPLSWYKGRFGQCYYRPTTTALDRARELGGLGFKTSPITVGGGYILYRTNQTNATLEENARPMAKPTTQPSN